MLRGLHSRNLSSHRFGGNKSGNRVSAGQGFLLRVAGEDLLMASPLGFEGPLHVRMAFSVSKCSLLVRTTVYWARPHHNGLILTWCLLKILSPNVGTLRVRTSKWTLRIHNSIHNTHLPYLWNVTSNTTYPLYMLWEISGSGLWIAFNSA